MGRVRAVEEGIGYPMESHARNVPSEQDAIGSRMSGFSDRQKITDLAFRERLLRDKDHHAVYHLQ
jgi:hypothetical protein